MKRILRVLLAIMLLGASAPVAATTTPDCIDVETQDWWKPTAGAPLPEQPSHGHARVRCLPRGTVSGVVPLTLEILWHNNAGEITRIKFQDDLNYQFVHKVSIVPEQDVPFDFTLNVDTGKMANSGWRLFRTYVFITQPDGNSQVVRGIYPVFVANGKPRKDAASTWIKPTGWYKDLNPLTDSGYVHASFKRTTVPAGPVSGPFTLGLQCQTNGGQAPSLTELYLDPTFHDDNPNNDTLLFSDAGGFSGSVTIPDLPAGDHRLVHVCHQTFSGGRSHAGVGALTITAK